MHRKKVPALDVAVAPGQGVTRHGQPISYNRAPSPELMPWVSRLYVAKVILPDDYVLSCGIFNDSACLRVQLAGEWTALTADGPRQHGRAALFFGPQTRRMPITVTGSFISVGASFHPGALNAIHGVKVRDHLDRLRPAADIDPHYEGLEHLFELSDSPEFWLQALEGAILRIVTANNCSPPDPVTARFEEIVLRAPSRHVSDAARECGVDRRRLERLCVRDFGLPPKQVMRRARALDMASLLRGVAEPEEREELALRYYDESHLIREFAELFGMPPRQFVVTPQPIMTLALESRQSYRLEALKRIAPGASRPWE